MKIQLGDNLKGKGLQLAQADIRTEDNLIGKIKIRIVAGMLGMGSFTKEFVRRLKEMNDIICNYLVKICKNTYLCFTPAPSTKNPSL